MQSINLAILRTEGVVASAMPKLCFVVAFGS